MASGASGRNVRDRSGCNAARTVSIIVPRSTAIIIAVIKSGGAKITRCVTMANRSPAAGPTANVASADIVTNSYTPAIPGGAGSRLEKRSTTTMRNVVCHTGRARPSASLTSHAAMPKNA